MEYIGIDMSKATFHVAFGDEHVQIFQNTKDGIALLLETLRMQGLTQSTVTLGVEATGVYHLLLAETLRSQEWCLKVINPLISSRMIKTTLRRVKTDKTDAIAIRKSLMTGAGYVYTDTPEILALKTLVQEREALVHMRATCRQRQHAHEYKQQATNMPLYESFTTVVQTCSNEIVKLDKKMSTYAKPTQQLLQSIPGIGKTSASALVAHIGDITRFSSPEKLTAYIGMDCRVHESGTSIHGKGYISKRGNKYLRSLLFNAAFIARQHNPDLKRFFELKVGEGKHYFVALCAVERKLIHLIYAVWKRGTPFENR